MKRWKLSVIVAAILLPASFTVALAQTQAGMNSEACGRYAKADAELNTIYRRVVRERESDALFTRRMRAAQRAWVAYRDAHLAALYPAADPRQEYGSAYPACRCAALTEVTRKRAEELRRWTGGAAEGDVCAGSTRAQSKDDGGMSTNVGEYERADSVFRKRWTLTGMGERSFATGGPYLEFDVKQGRFSGSSGCNRISGGYYVGFGAKRDDLKITPVASTRRACPGGEQQVETAFLKALEATTRFEVRGNDVRLYANDSLILTFRAGAPGR